MEITSANGSIQEARSDFHFSYGHTLFCAQIHQVHTLMLRCVCVRVSTAINHYSAIVFDAENVYRLAKLR